MLSLQTFGASQLNKHVQKPKRIQQTEVREPGSFSLPWRAALAQGNGEQSSLTWSLRPDHHIQSAPTAPSCSCLSRFSWNSFI